MPSVPSVPKSSTSTTSIATVMVASWPSTGCTPRTVWKSPVPSALNSRVIAHPSSEVTTAPLHPSLSILNSASGSMEIDRIAVEAPGSACTSKCAKYGRPSGNSTVGRETPPVSTQVRRTSLVSTGSGSGPGSGSGSGSGFGFGFGSVVGAGWASGSASPQPARRASSTAARAAVRGSVVMVIHLLQ